MMQLGGAAISCAVGKNLPLVPHLRPSILALWYAAKIGYMRPARCSAVKLGARFMPTSLAYCDWDR